MKAQAPVSIPAGRADVERHFLRTVARALIQLLIEALVHGEAPLPVRTVCGDAEFLDLVIERPGRDAVLLRSL